MNWTLKPDVCQVGKMVDELQIYTVSYNVLKKVNLYHGGSTEIQNTHYNSSVVSETLQVQGGNIVGKRKFPR